MARLLVYYAHPGHRHSQVNRHMARAAERVAGITFVDLYAEYPRFDIDVEREQQRLLDHDVILFQFPVFWYSTPSLLKEWQDLVLEHGFAYGAGGYRTVVLDYRSEQLEMLRAFGVKVYFGDAMRPDLLHAAGIEHARMLVIAIDDRQHITELVRYVRANHPNVHVVARATDRHHVYELWAAGARDIIRETFDSSVRAGLSALEALGVHPFEAERQARQGRRFRQPDRPGLDATIGGRCGGGEAKRMPGRRLTPWSFSRRSGGIRGNAGTSGIFLLQQVSLDQALAQRRSVPEPVFRREQRPISRFPRRV